MIPGITTFGELPLGVLPTAYTLAVDDPLSVALRASSGRRTFLVRASGYNPETGSVEQITMSSDGYRTSAADSAAPNTSYPARLVNPGAYEVAVMSGGRLTPTGLPAHGDIELSIGTASERDRWANYVFPGRDVVSLVGTPGLDSAYFGPFSTGACSGLEIGTDTVRITVADRSIRLAKALQQRNYRGTGFGIKYGGSGSYTAHGSHSSAHSTTFECWCACAGNNAAGTAQVIASHASAWSAAGIDFWLEVGAADGYVRAYLYRGAGGALVGMTYAVDVRDNIDRHFALVLSGGTNGCVLYVDGVQVATATEPGFSSVTGVLECGRRNGAADSYFNGRLDEIRFFTSARTGSAIRATMTKEIYSPVAADFKGYWRLNENTGTSLADSSGNGKTGTASSITWVGTYEGGSDLAGTPKPLCFGRVLEMSPVLLDSQGLVYQVHDGSIQAVLSVKDQGYPLTAAGDVADLYAAAAPSAGTYKTNLARGYIRLGSKPAGILTASVEGDNTGGYVSNTGAVVSRLLTQRGGLQSTDIDQSSIAVLSSAIPGVIGYHTNREPVLVSDAVTGLLAAVGGWWTYTRAGLLRVQRLEDPTGLSAVGTISASDIIVGGVRREVPAPIVKSVRLGYERLYTTQDSGSLSTSLTEAQRQYLAVEFRYVDASLDPPSAAIYLDAEDGTPEATYFAFIADAQAEADRRRALYTVPRYTYVLSLADQLFRHNVGDIYTVLLPFADLTNGKKCVIVGVSESTNPETTTVTLWG